MLSSDYMKTIVSKTHIRTLFTIQAGEDGKPVNRFRIVPQGVWQTEFYGELIITNDHLNQMITNFNAGIRKAVPIDVDHDGGKAAGWVTALEVVEGDGLYATVEWTPYGMELLEGKIYKMMSPELSLNYLDPENSTYHGAVLIAGSLVNRPLFKELDFIVASDKSKRLTTDDTYVLLFKSDMNLQELLAKGKSNLTTEELEFVRANVSELTEEQRAEYEVEVEETVEEKEAREAKEAEELEAKEKAEKEAKEKAALEAKEKSEKKITISASEYEALKTGADKGSKAMAVLEAKEAGETIDTYIMNDKGGKILAKDKVAFVDFYLTCSETQREAFVKLLEVLPSKEIAKEHGKDAESIEAGEKATEVIKLANEMLKDNKVKSFSEGVSAVLKSRSDLKDYDKE